MDSVSIPAASIESQLDKTSNTLPESGQNLPQSGRVFDFVATAQSSNRQDAALIPPFDGHLQSTNSAEESHRFRRSATSENIDFPQKSTRELADVIEIWPTLPAHIKAAIMALVATVNTGQSK